MKTLDLILDIASIFLCVFLFLFLLLSWKDLREQNNTGEVPPCPTE